MQKINTGGTSNTNVPIFRCLAKTLLLPIEARHITHWATVDSENNATSSATAIAVNVERIIDLCISPIIPKILMAFGGWLYRTLVTQLSGAKTVREKHQQQANADAERRDNCQNQVQALESQVHEVSDD